MGDDKPSTRVVWAADSPDVMVATSYPFGFGNVMPSHDGGKTWFDSGGVLAQTGITVSKTQNKLDPKIPPFVSMSANGKEVRVRIGYTIYVSHDGFSTLNFDEGNYGETIFKGMKAWTTQAQYISPNTNVEYSVGDGLTIWKKPNGGKWELMKMDECCGPDKQYGGELYSVVSDGDGSHVVVSGDIKPGSIEYYYVKGNPAAPGITIVPGPANLSMAKDGSLSFYTFMGNKDKGCETLYSKTPDPSWTFPADTWTLATQPTPWCPNDVVVTPSGNRAVALISNAHVWYSDKATNSPQVGAKWDPMTITPMLPVLQLQDIAMSPDGKTMVVAGTIDSKPLEFRIYRITCP